VRSGLRSLLFVPGDDERKLSRAAESEADALILDLEDAVSPPAKPAAREQVLAFLGESGPAVRARQMMVRINGADTPWFRDDVDALLEAGVIAVMLPKSVLRTAAAVPPGLEVLALIETARGVEEALAVAETVIVRRLMLGSADLAADLGVPARDDEQELAYPRARLAMCSAAAGIEGPVDVVSLAVRELGPLRESAARAKSLGFTGKACIHPAQVAPVNEIFTPAAAEVSWAQGVLNAFDAAEAAGLAVTMFEGSMVDAPVVTRARRILAWRTIS
jgi:citrate lyase subunit beta / citryl-CoA lyase